MSKPIGEKLGIAAVIIMAATYTSVGNIQDNSQNHSDTFFQVAYVAAGVVSLCVMGVLAVAVVKSTAWSYKVIFSFVMAAALYVALQCLLNARPYF